MPEPVATQVDPIKINEKRLKRPYNRHCVRIETATKVRKITETLCQRFHIPNFDGDPEAEFNPAYAAIKDYATAYVARDKLVYKLRSVKDPEEYEAKVKAYGEMLTRAWERLRKMHRTWKSLLDDDSGDTPAVAGDLADALARRNKPS